MGSILKGGDHGMSGFAGIGEDGFETGAAGGGVDPVGDAFGDVIGEGAGEVDFWGNFVRTRA